MVNSGKPKLLEVKNISKSFGGIHAVDNVSFSITEGEIIGLIGPNGSGKSTCVNLISGVYKLDAGEVIFMGKNIGKLSVQARAKEGVSRTFQTPKPFVGMTVYDSVFTSALQKHTHLDAKIKTNEILEFTQLAPHANLYSEKLPIERRKWLDLARILAIDAKIIMLDEVMAGLNPSEMEDSIELVKRINASGITILFIEHVMKAVCTLCERSIVLNEGKLLKIGNTFEMLNDEDVIKAYLGEDYHHAKN
jgi:branched-chain amino acid transport system ATP-binding protein